MTGFTRCTRDAVANSSKYFEFSAEEGREEEGDSELGSMRKETKLTTTVSIIMC